MGRTLSADMLAEFDRPVGLGPVITADTTGPIAIAELADQVQVLLAAPRHLET